MLKSHNVSNRTLPLAAIAFALLASFLPSPAFAQIVIGNGRMETERRSVPAFRSIAFSGSGDLEIRRGPQRLAVTADENVLPFVESTVSGGKLHIGFKPGISIIKPSKLVVEIAMPELEELTISGSGVVVVGRFEGDSFEATISGSGSLRADLGYGSVDFTISGSGGIALAGRADEASVRISGSGSLDARDFAAADARISISGSGNAELRVSKRLDVDSSGSGGVRYWGSPRLSTDVKGSGSVRKAGD
jgi:hypothetical protein